ncbi:MAG: hypothetical protein ACRC6X_00805 [Culicoidibacterales bacterium]
MFYREVKYENKLILISLNNQNNIADILERYKVITTYRGIDELIIDLFINTLSEHKRFLCLCVINGIVDINSAKFQNVSPCIKSISTAVFKEYQSSLEEQIFPPRLRALFFNDNETNICH